MASRTDGARLTARAAQAAETRQRLIDAAVEQFAERTYDEVAVADICQAADAAHGLVFHYFGTKRGLYLEAVRDTSNRVLKTHTLRPGISPVEQLRSAFTAQFRYLAAHRGLALRLVLGGRGADPEAWELLEAGRWQTIEAWILLLGLDPQNQALRMMLRSVVGAIDEAAVYWLQNDEPFPVEAVVERLIELTGAALRSAAALDPALDAESAIQPLLDEFYGS
ncbi:TetR/AcrR family transcriptional regulator [Nocardia canadensis]|uniref:TetR/AcrR family transcriptional regulator n=1 Tax=Nocardia canadensis TaxID=3065238 RepID=UPI0029307071|nr:TetR family transcriptional regulator [Nocardia canadensis]